jgi:hypothetical protein
MINKELSEILDALTRETGDTMSPCKELELLGFDPFGRVYNIKGVVTFGESDDEVADGYGNIDDDDYIDEEYEFDEDDEQYALLAQVLRLNNCRKKYFA